MLWIQETKCPIWQSLQIVLNFDPDRLQQNCIAMDTKVIEIVFLTVRWATKGLNSSGGGRHGCFNLIWKKIITPSASQKLQIGPVERPLVM